MPPLWLRAWSELFEGGPNAADDVVQIVGICEASLLGALRDMAIGDRATEGCAGKLVGEVLDAGVIGGGVEEFGSHGSLSLRSWMKRMKILMSSQVMEGVSSWRVAWRKRSFLSSSVMLSLSQSSRT